jgi:hypothetical protein
MSGVWATVLTLFVLLVAVVPPILLRGWLNRIPHLWQVFFPLLTFLAGYLVVRAVRRREGWMVVATWGLLCAGATCAAVFHILGAPRVFYSLGRGLSIAFIVAQAVQVLADGYTGPAERA